MAERQRFGCLDTWPYNCKQTSSLWFPIRSFTVIVLYLLIKAQIKDFERIDVSVGKLKRIKMLDPLGQA